MLSVSLSRELIPAFARILLRTSLGKKHLVRPLLRTEITQVVNRRAWYDATKLTTEILSLYKVFLPTIDTRIPFSLFLQLHFSICINFWHVYILWNMFFQLVQLLHPTVLFFLRIWGIMIETQCSGGMYILGAFIVFLNFCTMAKLYFAKNYLKCWIL